MQLGKWLGKPKIASIFPYATLIIGALLFSVLPLVWCIFAIGSDWKGVIPPLIDDQYVYYARMREVTNGLPWIGHPYYSEHRGQPSSVFVAADWAASVPMLLGAPLITTVAINSIFWSVAFVLSGYALFRSLKLKSWYAVIASLGVFAFEYWAILRPVSYQVFFWLVPLFWLSCLWLLRGEKKYRTLVLLVATSVLSIYLYPFLSLCVAGTLATMLAWFIFKRDWQSTAFLSGAGLITGIIASPALLYSAWASSVPYYIQTLRRISLVETRMPTGIAIFAITLVVIATLVWLTYSRFYKSDGTGTSKAKDDDEYFVWAGIVGTGLIFAAVSNLLSNKEMEIGHHVVIFVYLWFHITILACTFKVLPVIKHGLRRGVVGISLSALLFLPMVFGGWTLWIFRRISDPVLVRDVQSYAAPMSWLGERRQGAVIWTDDYLSYFVTAFTNDYVLYSPHGKYFLMSDEEVRERYLISRVFDDLARDQIRDDYWQYAGAGAQHRLNQKNLWPRLCSRFHLGNLGVICGQPKTIEQEVGQDVLEKMFQDYQTIKKETCILLHKYKVAYILKDAQRNAKMRPESMACTRLEYTDGRFEIFSITE